MSRRAGLLAVLGVVAALCVAVVVALTADDRRTTDGPSRPIVYVAVGASDTVGVGTTDPSTEAWPVVFVGEALPQSTRFTNVGVSGSTVAQALTEQVPKAVAAAGSPVANRAATWPVSDGAAEDGSSAAPAARGTAKPAPQRATKPFDWANPAGDPWQLKSFGN